MTRDQRPLDRDVNAIRRDPLRPGYTAGSKVPRARAGCARLLGMLPGFLFETG